MIKSDFHVHSSFSGDCHVKMEEMIEHAVKLNLSNLCFTEHHDLDLIPVDESITFLLDFQAYHSCFFELKEKYSKSIQLLLGIELGIQPHLYSDLTKITKESSYDFILCSNHVAKGVDPYNPEFFFEKSKRAAYTSYFEDILTNVKNYNDYDVYGHLDYVIRYGPYEDKHYLYKDFQDILDEILKTIIGNGKGIELNTSGYRYKLGNPHPSVEVITRYRELGGEIITLGSDAHRPEQLCYYFTEAESILKTAGFKYYSVFKNRQPEFIVL